MGRCGQAEKKGGRSMKPHTSSFSEGWQATLAVFIGVVVAFLIYWFASLMIGVGGCWARSAPDQEKVDLESQQAQSATEQQKDYYVDSPEALSEIDQQKVYLEVKQALSRLEATAESDFPYFSGTIY